MWIFLSRKMPHFVLIKHPAKHPEKLYPWLIENNHKSVTLVTKIGSIPELMQHAVAIIRKSLALNTLDAIVA